MRMQVQNKGCAFDTKLTIGEFDADNIRLILR